MPVIGPRKRTRNSAVPANNRSLAGVLNIRNYTTKALVAKYADVFTSTNSEPAIRKTTWDELHPGPPFVTGGPFSSVELVRPQHTIQDVGQYSCELWYNQANNWSYWYDGGFYDPTWLPYLDSVPDSEYNSLGTVYSQLYPDISGIGSGAYARLRPSAETSGLYVALREAKDIPRMLKTSSEGFHFAWDSIRYRNFQGRGLKRRVKMAPKSAANHFLNHQFGWIPFLKDLSSFKNTFQNSLKLRTQIARDNGRWIRRKRADKQLESDTLVYERTDVIGCQPDGWPFSYGYSNPHFTIRLQEYTDVWYEGMFRYFRPEFRVSPEHPDYSKWDRLQQELTLYGARISPTHVWQATPWSWLVDWFTNVGDVIQATEDWATDQVVSKYMYLMHRRRRVFELRSRFRTIHDGVDHDLRWYRSADIKRRQPAGSPFEFNLSAELTARQIAILGALGLSRR